MNEPTEETNTGMLEAISAAVEGKDPPAAPEPESTPPEDDAEGSTAPEGAESADDEAKPEGDEAEEGDDAAEGEEGTRERNPDGTFKKAGEKKPEGEQKPDDKKAEPKKADPLNDPIPTDLKRETQDRIRSLIKTAKESGERAAQVQESYDYLVNGIKSAGVSPEQFGETISFLSLFNSGDPEQQGKALDLLESVADRLATMLGRERTVADPLAQHADLKAAVQSGQIQLQYAKEIARTRNAGQFQQQMSQTARQQQQEQQQAEQALQTARNELTALEQTLKESDPDYERKKAILVPALQPVFQALHPSQWPAKFREAYRNVNLPSATTAAARPAPKDQPMRAGKQPAGGQTRAPGNMLEAVNAALAGMGK